VRSALPQQHQQAAQARAG